MCDSQCAREWLNGLRTLTGLANHRVFIRMTRWDVSLCPSGNINHSDTGSHPRWDVSLYPSGDINHSDKTQWLARPVNVLSPLNHSRAHCESHTFSYPLGITPVKRQSCSGGLEPHTSHNRVLSEGFYIATPAQAHILARWDVSLCRSGNIKSF